MSLIVRKRRKSSICYNCDTPLLAQENYCPNCGQENNSKQASIAQLSNDFLSDYLAFDSRLFRSIVPLITEPGRVTIDYLDGKRQRFIPPIRVFLFLSFLFFGLSYLTGDNATVLELSSDESDKAAEATSQAFANNFNILLFLYTPLFSVLIRLFFKSEKRNFFVNFFVYSLHLFSVFFILGSIQTLFFKLFYISLNEEAAAIASLSVQVLTLIYSIYYCIVSLKRVFEKNYTVLRFIAVFLISVIAFMLLTVVAVILLFFINQ